jgi:hypothetical protein
MTTWDNLRDGIASADSAATLFKGEYDSLLADVQERNATIDEQGAEIDTLTAQLAVTKASLNEALKSNVTLVDKNTLLTTQVRQLRATVASQQARIAELEAQLTPGKRCELPIATITALRGRWQKPGNANVGVLNEVWNTAEAGPQTLYVCDESSWYVKTNQPKAGLPATSGSVKSYPCTQWLFPKTPISSLKTLSLDFAHEFPKKGLWNAAIDAWVGGLGSASTAEVMVWPEYIYPAKLPPANALKTDTVTIDGVTYIAWTRKNSNQGDYIALVAKDAANMRSHGTIDLLKIFKYLQGLGWLKTADTLAAVNYGVEISSTELTDQVFRINENKLSWS